MEARLTQAALLAVVLLSLGARHKTPNFVVTATSPAVAEQVGEAAEKFRKELAIDWLGKELPKWAEPCPITVKVGDKLGAGGATSFLFDRGEVYGWRMNIQGSLERVLDSVLPHEVTHTIFASHFRQPLPRWADEGACTTVEHASERHKQEQMLIQFLRTGRGIAFSEMFVMKEYPADVMPLYSQGYSLARFLIGQGGKRKYLNFLAEGLKNEDWVAVTHKHYGFDGLGTLQNTWLDWVRQGCPTKATPSAVDAGTKLASAAETAPRRPRPEPNLIYRAQSEDPPPSRPLVPVVRQPAAAAPSNAVPSNMVPSNMGASASPPRAEQPLPQVAAMPASTPLVQPANGPGKVLLEWTRPQPAAVYDSSRGGIVRR